MSQPTSTGRTWAVSMTVFAAAFMMVSGVLTAIQGMVALANSECYVVVRTYTFQFDVTAWVGSRCYSASSWPRSAPFCSWGRRGLVGPPSAWWLCR
jgi:hypothetical protein